MQDLAKAKSIDITDLDLLLFTDSIEEAMAHIREHSIKQFGLVRRAPKRSWLLGER